jgi:hypothetical protein
LGFEAGAINFMARSCGPVMIDDSLHPADRFFLATGNFIALPREKAIEKCEVNKYYRHRP